MKVFLADLVHNFHKGDIAISGDVDFVVPLNVAKISSYIKSNIKCDIKIFKYPTDILNALEIEEPHVVGFSNYIWNQELNKQIAIMIKNEYPNTLIVYGGPTIRTDKDGIKSFLLKNTFVDCYVLFEGERPFLEILRNLEIYGNKLFEENIDFESIAYLKKGDLIYQEKPQTEDVNNLPSPYLDGTMDQFLDMGLIPLYETNRGCPYQCTFCAWGISALTKVRKFSIDQIFSEFEYVSHRNPKLSAWIIGDANFGLFKRDIEVANKIRDIKNATPGLKHILTWESKNTTESKKSDNKQTFKAQSVTKNGKINFGAMLQRIEGMRGGCSGCGKKK